MPRISAFYGIVIAMYHREHGVPHFHASYGGYEAVISIATFEPLAGALPPRAMRLVPRVGEDSCERASGELGAGTGRSATRDDRSAAVRSL